MIVLLTFDLNMADEDKHGSKGTMQASGGGSSIIASNNSYSNLANDDSSVEVI